MQSFVTGSEPLSVVPFLRALGEVGGSDLHIKVGSPPRVRIDGRLRKLQAPNLTPVDTEHMFRLMTLRSREASTAVTECG